MSDQYFEKLDDDDGVSCFVWLHDECMEMITDNVGEYTVTPFRARKILGGCVKIAEEPREVFSKLMLLFSLTDSWVGGDEDTSFSQIMCVL